MIEEYTARMVCKSDIELKNGIPVPPEPANNGEISLINLLNLQPRSGMEYGFMFYEKNGTENICHIHFENKRREFEISYGTEIDFRRKGYMQEALAFFVNWIFTNTKVPYLYALISNNDDSQHILEKQGFCFETHDQYGSWFILTRQ